MKHLLMVTAAILVLTGCASTRDAGRPGDESSTEQSSERKASDNINDVGRQSSPTSPLSSPNGSLNF